MAEELEQNTENIPCPECKNFVADNPDTPDQELACLAGCPDFLKQLVSGETKVCSKAERKT